ncbi:beta-N-acetylhexosaminidase [Paraglaciecola psychrophila]|uniref:Beta-hexosaminidase n=1 Tax=Paraglaciecola psychrophila 170 TaxID=1129794 RepID=K6ZUG5_9ALTE|nr:beta-N-acetylhexosaminidase [Paraglaciecola psychrophila]AGH45230.1 glycoside hydrolase family protein [Paraglaciecola psychrophila 170]GAC39536.1 beta-N-acetylhexosaminidase [Paraglaciecola psychrophila 170]
MGPLMLDVSGFELTHEEIDILDHPLVGGLILFSRNYHDQKQLSDLVRHIRSVTRNDVLIATDHEGGRVQRFRQGFSDIPAMGRIHLQTDGDIQLSGYLCEQFGWLMAAELLTFDIDISFAPVLDIHGVSAVIGDRSFHQQPDIIVQLASKFIKGMHRAGMSATGKHFPGHGNILEDSHIAMPVDKRSREEIFALDMAIFKSIHQQGLLDAVMPAHVIYPDVDDLPAGFSQQWIKQILRQELDFNGVVFSDDLSMQGAVQMGNIVDRAELAIEAGCDMVLVCNDPKGAVKVIDELPSGMSLHKNSLERITRLRKTTSVDFSTLKKTTEHQIASKVLDQFYAN